MTGAGCWLREAYPAKKPKFDAAVINPLSATAGSRSEEASQDSRFENHGVVFINAADHFVKGKRQNQLTE